MISAGLELASWGTVDRMGMVVEGGGRRRGCLLLGQLAHAPKGNKSKGP